MVAQLKGVENRDQAATLMGCDIAVTRADLPALKAGEYYWTDLIGATVVDAKGVSLGLVDRLFETGANDVMVVRGAGHPGSELLIPWVLPSVITQVDLPAATHYCRLGFGLLIMRFGVVTLFPELVQAVLDAGVVGRAAKRGQVAVEMQNPRDFTEDPHRTVDDRPYGGGPGMVMKPAPLIAAIEAAQATIPDAAVICLSPQGKVFDQQMARRWQQHGSLILVSGRYEGYR